jgi:hypothetical protein
MSRYDLIDRGLCFGQLQLRCLVMGPLQTLRSHQTMAGRKDKANIRLTKIWVRRVILARRPAAVPGFSQ